MRLIRLLAGALVLGALAWTGWWYALARSQEAALDLWFADRQRAGWQADHDGIGLTGFPFRLTREVSGIHLADPRTGWAWVAPWFRIESATFKPNRFDVTWPEKQTVAIPGERAQVASATMNASLELKPERALGLVRAAADLAALDVRSQAGWTARAGTLDAEVVQRVNDPGYEIRFRADKVLLPEPVVARIDPLGLVSREVERLGFDGAAVFADPLDRHTIEDGRLALRQARIRRADLQWGQMRLEAKGEIDVDRDGYPVGKLDVTARHWREIIALAERSGAIGRDMAGTLTTALEVVAMLGGNRDELDATFRFSDGQVWLGPVSVGRAPRLAPPQG